MYLWAIYILPGSVCLLCLRKYVDRFWEYINRPQTHECGNGDWGRTIPFLWIHKWNFGCSVLISLNPLILSFPFLLHAARIRPASLSSFLAAILVFRLLILCSSILYYHTKHSAPILLLSCSFPLILILFFLLSSSTSFSSFSCSLPFLPYWISLLQPSRIPLLFLYIQFSLPSQIPVSSAWPWVTSESIECFEEGQAFSCGRIIRLLAPPSPLSRHRQWARSATNRKIEKERQVANGSGGRGWTRSRIIRPQESPVLYKSFNTLWVICSAPILSSPTFTLMLRSHILKIDLHMLCFCFFHQMLLFFHPLLPIFGISYITLYFSFRFPALGVLWIFDILPFFSSYLLLSSAFL